MLCLIVINHTQTLILKSMKNTHLLLIGTMLIVGAKSYGQTPFTTLSLEPRFLKETGSAIKKFEAITDSEPIRKIAKDTAKEKQEGRKSNKNDSLGFFKYNGLTLNIINKGENRLSVNSQVLYYKLYMCNPKEADSIQKYRFNIPFLVITKLSNNYDSVNASSSLDVLDYEAAPITLRIMPSFNKTFANYTDVFYWGGYVDLRVLNLYSPSKKNYDMEFIGSGGIGFTYQGYGEAGSYNPNGESAPGRYSLSVILQGAKGKKEVIQRLFNTDKDYVFSVQSYFIFKTKENSPLNIKIGYQYFFKKTIAGTKSNFSVALGI